MTFVPLRKERGQSARGGGWLRAALGTAAACAMLANGACGGSSGRKWYSLPKSGSSYVDMALDSAEPARRREGVIGLSESRDGATDWAIRVYEAVARHDSDAMVRWAALRALADARAGDSAPLALALLRSGQESVEDIRPAPPVVRWGAARLLHVLSDANIVAPELREETVTTVLASLDRESHHDLRLSLIDTLGYYPERRAADRLIELLEEDDFAVQRSAEFALARMTGVTHRYDPVAWRAWFASEGEPFARGGALPEELAREPNKPRWDWLSAG